MVNKTSSKAKNPQEHYTTSGTRIGRWAGTSQRHRMADETKLYSLYFPPESPVARSAAASCWVLLLETIDNKELPRITINKKHDPNINQNENGCSLRLDLNRFAQFIVPVFKLQTILSKTSRIPAIAKTKPMNII